MIAIAEIERVLLAVAYVVSKHGPVYAPILERLEKELAQARRADPVAHARHILATYAPNGPAGYLRGHGDNTGGETPR